MTVLYNDQVDCSKPKRPSDFDFREVAMVMLTGLWAQDSGELFDHRGELE